MLGHLFVIVVFEFVQIVNEVPSLADPLFSVADQIVIISKGSGHESEEQSQKDLLFAELTRSSQAEMLKNSASNRDISIRSRSNLYEVLPNEFVTVADADAIKSLVDTILEKSTDASIPLSTSRVSVNVA